MTEKPRLLMCRPDFFGVDYAINPWMDPASWARDAEALAASAGAEWRAYHRTLQRLGAAIHLVPPAPGLPDLVFTANGAVVMDGTALLARFRHPERQGEEDRFECMFRRLASDGVIDRVRHLPASLRLEGAGDCVWDRTRGLFWMGYGLRSDQVARGAVEDCFGIETVALELVDPRFYHMDTALNPLPGGEVMYVPGAFTGDGLAELHARVAPGLRIPVEADDAALLAANAVSIGHDIVLSQCSESLRARIEERGYKVHRSPLTSFTRSGGAAFCLTLRLDLRSEGAARSVSRGVPALALG
jgi:N-dimethylarginine dimethylaminohydrolase